MNTRARLVATLCAAASAAGIGLATPAAAQPERIASTCTTYRSSDGKDIGVSCVDTGPYYVVGVACSAGGCTTIGGNIVSAPATSRAYAGSGYFGGDIRAVFV